MRTVIEIQIGDGKDRPTVTQDTNGGWVVLAEAEQCVPYGRGVWVKTFAVGNTTPKDGKGFLIGPTRKLKLG